MGWVRTDRTLGSPVGLQSCQTRGEYHGLGRAGTGRVSGCTLASESSLRLIHGSTAPPGAWGRAVTLWGRVLPVRLGTKVAFK